MDPERSERNQQPEIREPNDNWRPDYVLVDRDFNVYWSIKDIARSGELSKVRISELVRTGRIRAVRPSGREWFVSIDAYREYLESGRIKPGPTPKSE